MCRARIVRRTLTIDLDLFKQSSSIVHKWVDDNEEEPSVFYYHEKEPNHLQSANW